MPPLHTPKLILKEAEPVTVTCLDPGTMQGDELSSIICPLKRLSGYAETGDEESEEEGKLTGDAEEWSSRQRIIESLCILQNIHQGLLMEDNGIKDLINIVEGMDITGLPAVLPVLRSVTGVVSC